MLTTLSDFEIAASKRLPADVLAYLEGGAEAERSVAENNAAFGRIGLLPRLLADCGQGHTRTTILGADAVHGCCRARCGDGAKLSDQCDA